MNELPLGLKEQRGRMSSLWVAYNPMWHRNRHGSSFPKWQRGASHHLLWFCGSVVDCSFPEMAAFLHLSFHILFLQSSAATSLWEVSSVFPPSTPGHLCNYFDRQNMVEGMRHGFWDRVIKSDITAPDSFRTCPSGVLTFHVGKLLTLRIPCWKVCRRWTHWGGPHYGHIKNMSERLSIFHLRF